MVQAAAMLAGSLEPRTNEQSFVSIKNIRSNCSDPFRFSLGKLPRPFFRRFRERTKRPSAQ